MVDRQIEDRGIGDERILQAMRTVPRHLFTPDHDLSTAYGDHPLGIGSDQTISQPYIVAYMTDALKLGPADRILEIGTGSGYQTAVLAELVDHVYTIERLPELSEKAHNILLKLGYRNISFRTADGRQGWIEEAPFDGILVTAAPDKPILGLIDLLKPGGGLVIPVGGSGSQTLMRYTRTETEFSTQSLLSVRFVPLV